MCFKVLKKQIVEKFFTMTSNLDKNIRALKKILFMSSTFSLKLFVGAFMSTVRQFHYQPQLFVFMQVKSVGA